MRTSDRRSVFLSYGHHDKVTAQLLGLRLQEAGVEVWLDADDLKVGDNWRSAIERNLRTSDYVIVLISSAGSASSRLNDELLSQEFVRELSDRSITLIPILLDDVELPDALRHIQYLDFRADTKAAVEDLVSMFEQTVEIDFSTLSPHQFEDLVADLLFDLGYQAEREVRYHHRQFDFRFSWNHLDPFGGSAAESWLIEVKHYSSGRLSAAIASEFVTFMAQFRGDQNIRVALITSSQVTSTAREIFQHAPIRLVEGVELKRILLTRPELVRKHFAGQRLK